MQVNRKIFFEELKKRKLFSSFTDGQVQGIDALLDEAERLGVSPAVAAYVFGTVYHEVDRTMQPIEEYGKGKGKNYGTKLKYGGGPGKRIPYSKPDKIYYGRGLTQNTWYEIYEKLTKTDRARLEGWDFLNHPELLLQMKPSVWATYYAMLTGLYTGKKLSKYFSATKNDWVGARAIVNGNDKADQIAGYAKNFFFAFVQSTK